MNEREHAKYYSIMADATPDASHIEQTTFILRYLTRENESYVVQERFLAFVDCCHKTGIAIGNLILETLKGYGIPIADCRGQGYNKAANIRKYKLDDIFCNVCTALRMFCTLPVTVSSAER